MVISSDHFMYGGTRYTVMPSYPLRCTLPYSGGANSSSSRVPVVVIVAGIVLVIDVVVALTAVVVVVPVAVVVAEVLVVPEAW